MPVGWYLAPYKAHPVRPRARYCAVNDLTAQIVADGGDWTETEVLGQHAIVKVRAAAATLTLVAALTGVTRIPVARLDDPLSSLTAPQKTAIRNRVTGLGYTLAELQERFPNDLGTYTLRDLLTFVARRRKRVRFDAQNSAFIDDGDVLVPRSVTSVDAAVA